MKSNILFIMGGLGDGGGQRSLINLLQLIDNERYNVDLVLFKEKGIFFNQLPEYVNLLSDCDILHFMYSDRINSLFSLKHPILAVNHLFGTLISKVKTKSGFQKGQYRWEKYYSKLIPSIRKHYDVAISYMEGEATYFLVDKVCASKKIAWVHTDYSQIEAYEDFDLRYYLKVDKVVTISDICLSVLKNTFPSIKDKITVLHNLVNSTEIRRLSEVYIPTELQTDRLCFISIGRLVKLKGFDLAISAAAILKKKGIKFSWFILGEGEERENLEKQIIDENVSDCFFLLGAIANPYPFIKYSDIVVQTSRYEGKSMVLDEAKILAKPIVVTNYDTVCDQINEKEGIIVSMTSDEIAAGICRMIKEKTKFSNNLKSNEYGNESELKLFYDLLDSKRL